MNPPICPLELPTPMGLAGIGARVGESPRPGAGSDSQTPGARQEPAQGTSPWAPGPKKDGRRGRNRDGDGPPRSFPRSGISRSRSPHPRPIGRDRRDRPRWPYRGDWSYWPEG